MQNFSIAAQSRDKLEEKNLLPQAYDPLMVIASKQADSLFQWWKNLVLYRHT